MWLPCSYGRASKSAYMICYFPCWQLCKNSVFKHFYCMKLIKSIQFITFVKTDLVHSSHMQKELISGLLDSFLILMKIGTALDISFTNTTRGHFTPLGTFLLKTNEWNRPQYRRKWKHLFQWRTNTSLMLHSHGRRKMGNSRESTAAG